MKNTIEKEGITGWVYNPDSSRLTYLSGGTPKGGFIGDVAERVFGKMIMRGETEQIYINGTSTEHKQSVPEREA